MLAGLLGAFVAAGLLLRGAWDLWAQSALLLGFLAGATVWLCARISAGWLPRPSGPALGWACGLAVLSGLSAYASPLGAYARPAWAAAAAGLALFPLVSVVDAEERAKLETWLRGAAWALVLFAIAQRVSGDSRPASALINQNAFAGAILLLLPIAARAGDWALTAGLLLCLWWTKSVGAWLGLSAALVLHRRLVGTLGFWAGLGAGFVGLVAVYAKLQSPESAHRLAWWGAAWRMSLDAPWLGLGPASFPYALPAYVGERPELASLYAHQHLLETAAERGWPYLLLWLAGLGALLRRASPGRRFGPVAALLHGLFDYALSVPGVFWLFCATASLAEPWSGRGVNVPTRRRPALALAAVGLAVWAALGVARGWAADRMRANAADAMERAASPDPKVREAALSAGERALAGSEELVPHPEAARKRAEIALLRGGESPSTAQLEAAAAQLRRAAALDPYRSSNRALLEALERRLEKPNAR